MEKSSRLLLILHRIFKLSNFQIIKLILYFCLPLNGSNPAARPALLMPSQFLLLKNEHSPVADNNCNMKTTALILFFLVAGFTAQSQVNFLAFAGGHANTAQYFVRGQRQDASFKPGGIAGIGVKIPFENKLYFSPAVFYSLKGYKVDYTRFSETPRLDAVANNTTMHAIEAAFLFQFDFSSAPGHFFIKAGPSIETILAGTEKLKIDDGTNVERSMPFGFQNYGRYGANLIAQLGYETAGGFFIAAQYTRGLTDMSNQDGGPDIRQRAIGLTIGKYFHRSKN
jgi:hypothetical protein